MPNVVIVVVVVISTGVGHGPIRLPWFPRKMGVADGRHAGIAQLHAC